MAHAAIVRRPVRRFHSLMHAPPVAFQVLVAFIGVLTYATSMSVRAGDWVPSVAPTVPNQSTLIRSTSAPPMFTAGASGSLTFTDNVDLSPPGQEQSDFVLGVAIPLGLHIDGSRVKVAAQYTPTFYVYAKNGDSDYLQNNLSSLLSVQAVENYFFIDATANIYQSFISPFAARPASGASITSNRTPQTTLGLSPYIRHETGSGWTYMVRNDNYWNVYNTSGLDNSVTNSVSADLLSPYAPVRYGFDYSYVYTRFESGPTYYQQVARFRPILSATPRLMLSARLGYETNDYSTPSYAGPVYGAGIHWTPSPQTKLDGFVEHRFFGPSFGLNLGHRTPLTVWRLNGTRNNYTSQDQPSTLRPATSAEVLDDALRARYPDPVERQQAVEQYMRGAGLPPVLAEQYTFYTNQPYLAQQWTGSVAVLGATNLVELTLIWQDNQLITGNGSLVPSGGGSYGQLRQKGLTLTYSHRFSHVTTGTVAYTRLYSLGSDPLTATIPAENQATQNGIRLSLTRRLSPKTDGSIGVRWSDLDSITSPYRELAVFAILAHGF